MNFSRLRIGEIVAALGGIALFITMFLDWFGAGGSVAQSIPDAPGLDEIGGGALEEPKVSGWDALTDWDGFVIALAAVAGVALGALALVGRRLNIGGLPRGWVTAALGSLAVAVILYRLFNPPQEADVEFGIFLGLAAAIALTVGALMALRAGGFDPFPAFTVGAGRAPAGSRSTTRRTTARRASGGSRSTARRTSGSRSTSTRGSSGSRSSSSRASSGSRGGRSGGRRSSSSRKS